MLRRVVVTGIGGITAFGRDWASIQAGLAQGKNAVQRMNWAEQFPELEAQLGAPIPHYSPPCPLDTQAITQHGTRHTNGS